MLVPCYARDNDVEPGKDPEKEQNGIAHHVEEYEKLQGVTERGICLALRKSASDDVAGDERDPGAQHYDAQVVVGAPGVEHVVEGGGCCLFACRNPAAMARD